MKWTTRQEEVLRAHAAEGLLPATLALLEECGVGRSPTSVKVHAHRMGLSLAERYVCPECGHVGGPHDFRFGDGLCEACHVKRKCRELDRQDEALEREYQQRVDSAYKEHAKMRQRVSRHSRRLGGGEGESS